ncbi:MAG: SDR family oxidoreductase [Atopobiaceae bacterium]|jgi:short-subunit dehydrogenase|nr:SDR family oxidoreductase [Atopobiaceae bacterium]MCI2174142.1 SDR family oxidoreductase [Atopobiaceae bacterium]MCI2206783.1 SDR family oxidoreductase [Atopobiaceae bacterium]
MVHDGRTYDEDSLHTDAQGMTRRQTVLVTGASGGIGKEFARVFAQHGFDLVLVARNEERLESLAGELSDRYGVTANVIAADLSDEAAAERIRAEVHERGIVIDQLVNNAGAGKQMRTVDADPDVLRGLIHLNVTSVTLMCRLFGADMVEQGHGRILNVSSMGAFVPDPFFNVYGPTKAFEMRLTEAMRGELAGTGVTVSALCPGPVKTGWAANAGKADSGMAKGADLIARLGYVGMQRGRLIIVPTMLYKAERVILGVLPEAAKVEVIGRWQMSLIEKGREL